MSWCPCTTDQCTAVSIRFLLTTFKEGAGKVLVQGTAVNIRALLAIVKECFIQLTVSITHNNPTVHCTSNI
jgi:hypothetical protein